MDRCDLIIRLLTSPFERHLSVGGRIVGVRKIKVLGDPTAFEEPFIKVFASILIVLLLVAITADPGGFLTSAVSISRILLLPVVVILIAVVAIQSKYDAYRKERNALDD